jgi:hypothetical protein
VMVQRFIVEHSNCNFLLLFLKPNQLDSDVGDLDKMFVMLMCPKVLQFIK